MGERLGALLLADSVTHAFTDESGVALTPEQLRSRRLAGEPIYLRTDLTYPREGSGGGDGGPGGGRPPPDVAGAFDDEPTLTDLRVPDDEPTLTDVRVPDAEAPQVDPTVPQADRPFDPRVVSDERAASADQQARIDRLAGQGPGEVRLPDAGALAEAQRRLGAGVPTEADAGVILAQAVAEFRAFELASHSREGGPGLRSYDLAGMCHQGRDVTAMSVATLAARSGVDVRITRFSVDAAAGGRTGQSHQFSVVHFGTEPPMSFLIDPTYTQFVLDRSTTPVDAEVANGHGRGLSGEAEQIRRTAGGAALVESLAANGYVPLTPETGAMYLRSVYPPGYGAAVPDPGRLLGGEGGFLRHAGRGDGDTILIRPGERTDGRVLRGAAESEIGYGSLLETSRTMQERGRTDLAEALSSLAERLERAGMEDVDGEPGPVRADAVADRGTGAGAGAGPVEAPPTGREGTLGPDDPTPPRGTPVVRLDDAPPVPGRRVEPGSAVSVDEDPGEITRPNIRRADIEGPAAAPTADPGARVRAATDRSARVGIDPGSQQDLLDDLLRQQDPERRGSQLPEGDEVRREIEARRAAAAEAGTPLDFGPDDLVYGPSADGRLTELADQAGGRTLNDIAKSSVFPNFFAKSRFVLDWARTEGRIVHFDLTSVGDVRAALEGTGRRGDSVTSWELRYIQQLWDDPAAPFSEVVRFYRDGVRLERPPWDDLR